MSEGAPALRPRCSSQEGASAPGSRSLPPPTPPALQHRGQLPPAACRRRPARPARSREPRILARPRRRRAALSPVRGGSALTWESSEQGPLPPRLPPPPPPPSSRLRAPCSLSRSGISPPGTPDPAPGRGGAGREVRGAQRRRRSQGRRAGKGFSGSWSGTPFPSPSPTLFPHSPRSNGRPLGFLKYFGAPSLPAFSFNVDLPYKEKPANQKAYY